MIYGWSFHYDIGEKARGIREEFELRPVGTIPWGDPGLRATDARVDRMQFRLWTDYRLSETQRRRLAVWRTGAIRSAQAIGIGPLGGPVETDGWLAIRREALEDAARAAVRAALRGSERNRPKEAEGFISLAAFPAYFMDGGHWAASGRFRVEITRIVPFAAY
jgi:cation diffusion facilitator CzcD-associated flavoprotein CzcO